MYLYNIDNDYFGEIKEIGFRNEAELHKLCETNLDNVFGLLFIKREFSVNNFRIDTLAFDESNNAFVIIEYKNTNNFSVIDQGYAYLATMLNNKADFIIEYHENTDGTLKRKDVDWSQSRVIFVSPVFNNYQKQSINFKDLPIELWEVKKFENDIVYFNEIKATNKVDSIKTVSSRTPNTEVNIVNKEVKVYTEKDHFIKSSQEMIELYNKIKTYILSLDNTITLKCKKQVIGFAYKQKVIIDILLQKKALKIWLNTKYGTIEDLRQIARDASEKGTWGNGDYEIQIYNDDDIEYIFSLIKQLYKLRKEEKG